MEVIGFDEDSREYIVTVSQSEFHTMVGTPPQGSHYKQGYEKDLEPVAQNMQDIRGNKQQVENVIRKLKQLADIE